MPDFFRKQMAEMTPREKIVLAKARLYFELLEAPHGDLTEADGVMLAACANDLDIQRILARSKEAA
jgi:hypothetical protein